MLDQPRCRGCLEKMVRIDRLCRQVERLRQENASLKDQLGRRQRTDDERPFGSATPSAKLPFKPNGSEENRARKGGARPGHAGHGRAGACPEAGTVRIAAPRTCPFCGCPTHAEGWRRRRVVDLVPARRLETVYELERRVCPGCGRRQAPPPPAVLPKCLYSNRLLAHVAVEHYVHGTTLGQIEGRTGIGYGSLVDALHQLAARCEPALARLVEDYRRALVRHADETIWREDGRNGYAWLFATPETSLFRLRHTRSAQVPREVFGERPLAGVLVVDRYAAYNCAPCRLQYCYAHLLREVEDLEKAFPGQPEVAAFVAALAPKLAAAMHLPATVAGDNNYRRAARRLKAAIVAIVGREARHEGVRAIQAVFRENADRLYHWVEERRIPAHNNSAERELRPLVIARKLSFGSQSERGRQTRETLMSILNTLRKRRGDPCPPLLEALNRLAVSPDADVADLLFGPAQPCSQSP